MLSVACGLLGTIGLALMAERMHWCCVHGWAMMHGTGAVVFLAFALMGFHLISAIGARGGYLTSSWPPGWLAHTAYLAAALGTVAGADGGYVTSALATVARIDDRLTTVFLYVGSSDFVFMLVGLSAGVVACVLKMRGRPIRQFGLVIASLIVSCLSVAESAYVVWSMWQLRHPPS